MTQLTIVTSRNTWSKIPITSWAVIRHQHHEYLYTFINENGKQFLILVRTCISALAINFLQYAERLPKIQLLHRPSFNYTSWFIPNFLENSIINWKTALRSTATFQGKPLKPHFDKNRPSLMILNLQCKKTSNQMSSLLYLSSNSMTTSVFQSAYITWTILLNAHCKVIIINNESTTSTPVNLQDQPSLSVKNCSMWCTHGLHTT